MYSKTVIIENEDSRIIRVFNSEHEITDERIETFIRKDTPDAMILSFDTPKPENLGTISPEPVCVIVHRDAGRVIIRGSTVRVALLKAIARGVCLEGAQLAGADLSGLDLRGAKLKGANLQNADLSRCDLTDVSFHCVNIGCAKFDGSKGFVAPG